VTIVELITELQKYAPDTLVVVSGYEGGYSNPSKVSLIPVIKHAQDYFGDYEEFDSWWHDGELPILSVAIER